MVLPRHKAYLLLAVVGNERWREYAPTIISDTMSTVTRIGVKLIRIFLNYLYLIP